MNDSGGGSVPGRVIPLTELISLAGSPENQQVQAPEERSERHLAFILWAVTISLRLVDSLLENPPNEHSRDSEESCTPCAIRADDFAVEISGDFDMEDLKQSPDLRLQALQNLKVVKIPVSLQRNDAIEYFHALPDILQKLGEILYQVFSRGQSPPSRVQLEGSVGTVRETEPDQIKVGMRNGFDETKDEETPGAHKGRQKRFVENTSRSLRRIHITSDLEDSLTKLGLPSSISRFLKDLIEPVGDGECAFQSLEDVQSELRQFDDDPKVLLGYDETTDQCALDFGEEVIGRTSELTCLLEAAAQIEFSGPDPSFPNSLVLIGGNAGTGKSYLVESVSGTLVDNGWIFVNCKFDRLVQLQPLSTIASAFENFLQQIAEVISEGRDMGDILASIQNNLSASGIVVLSDLLPSLRTLYPAVFASIVEDDDSIISSEDEASSSGNISRENSQETATSLSCLASGDNIMDSAGTLQNRLHYLFRRLVHAISKPEHPLFLWVDDLQWIDESGIQLLASLLTESDHLSHIDENFSSILVVGSFRENEIDETHILSAYFKRFGSAASVGVRNIHLDAITKLNANVFVSKALRQPYRQIKALTDVVYAKTVGNPLYMKLFLKSLVDEKLLRFSLIEKRWLWEIDSIKAAPIDDNVAKLLTRKLRRLPEVSQKVLKIASCFGMTVDYSTLRISLASEQPLMQCLEYARQEGILEDEGIRFSHDLIQQAAYDLMSQEEKGACHFKIGIQLFRHVTSLKQSNQFSVMTFAAADQINKAKVFSAIDPPPDWSCLWEDTDTLQLASLNLRAGERSMEVADFSSGLRYLQYGIEFLPETPWDSNYELSLRLYESACLACHINAMPAKLTEFLTEILQNAESFHDKLKGLFVLLQSLASLGKINEAIEKMLVILSELGESASLPDEVTPSLIHDILMSTKSLLEGYSREDLVSAPRLNDTNMLWTLKLITHFLPYLFMAKPSLFPILGFRIIELSIKHGMANESAFGFSTYGFFLIAILNDITGGYRWGKIALSLVENTDAKKLVLKLKVLLYHTIFFLVEPLQSTSSALLQCYREALMAGDVESASFAAVYYCVQNVQCGSILSLVEKECEAIALELIQTNQHQCIAHLSNHQLVLKLTGSKKNPFTILQGSIKNEDELLQYAVSKGRSGLVKTISFYRLFVAFFLKQYEEAAKYTGKWTDQQSPLKGRPQFTYNIFYEGMLAFYFIRQNYEPKWVEIGENAISVFQTRAASSEWNWENKLALLLAEWHFSKGETEKAEEKYNLSITSAQQHRFIHEEGLANDLFSTFHTANGNIQKAKYHKSKARACYDKWGASALVGLLDNSAS